MKLSLNAIFVISLLIAFALVSCRENKKEELRLPFYNTPDFTPEWITTGDTSYPEIHQIDTFEFVNQNGEKVTNTTFDDQVYVADFFFTVCPGICPKMTNNLLIIQEEFAGDNSVLILSHSVTPKVDSVSQLKTYADLNQIDPKKWHLVTGDQDKIYEMARRSYFAEKAEGYDKPVEAFVHTENFVLVDHKRRIRGVYNGTLEVEMKRLIADINTLKEELNETGI